MEWVLILIVLEYDLWERLRLRNAGVEPVLILIAKEVSSGSVDVLLKSLHLLTQPQPAQGATIAMQQLRFLLRKIPCCNGICSIRAMKAKRGITPKKRLNPCYNGICSMRPQSTTAWSVRVKSLNPCFNGSINLFGWSLIEVTSFAAQPHSAPRRDYCYEATSILLRKIPCYNGICSMGLTSCSSYDEVL